MQLSHKYDLSTSVLIAIYAKNQTTCN